MSFVGHSPFAWAAGSTPAVQSGSRPRFGWGVSFITITLVLALGGHPIAAQVTSQAPPPDASSASLPEAPYPLAHRIFTNAGTDAPILESATQTYRKGIYTLTGDVVITARGRVIQADSIVYDSNTGDVTASGHFTITGGPNDEHMEASRGIFNLNTQTGRFYDVRGSVGMRALRPGSVRTIYTNSSPFLFSGRMVVKTGPQNYDVYDGSVTSCQLPNPDWILSAAHFSVDATTARAHSSIFHLLNVPLLYLPYVTHPVDANERQSGILIPTIGQSTTRGFTIGEQFYLVLGRSADLTVGAQYFSSIGFQQSANFRLRGPGIDFLNVRYNGVLDRRNGTANQGGEDVVVAGRHDLSSATRVATNVEYLSSYIYREAFTDSFNQAVTSDIVSSLFITRREQGVELTALADRYQGIKLIAQGTTPQQQVRIFHAPTLSVSTTDEVVPHTGFSSSDHTVYTPGLLVTLDSSASGLKRTQPNFVTSGIVERFDLHPQAIYPLSLAGWHLLPSFGVRDTVYSRSRQTPVVGQPPMESLNAINRADVEFAFGIRPPVLEATFTPPALLARIFGTQVRHTIEPEITYRKVGGVSNFANLLRFDEDDVVSNTNELEYGVTQRLFRRSRQTPEQAGKPCATAEVAAGPGLNADTESAPDGDLLQQSSGACGNESLISWRLTQKYFFDPTFGHAIVDNRRNIFQTTLDFSGVAFLTEAREISPLLSRLRMRTSAHTDVEWDFDFDTGAKRFTSSNVFLDLHQGNAFTALSYARLDAPGRFYTQNPSPTPGSPTGVSSLISDFNQLRVLVGYGSPLKPGLSVAANTGLDLKSLYGTTSTTTSSTGVSTSTTIYPALLQYASVQTSYNWNCCGLTVEYRKFELGSVRNEGAYRFNFTLANIGAAGNLRHAERLF